MTYSYRYPHTPQENRPTEAFPIVQRASIRFFRRMTHFWSGLFQQIGARGLFMRDTFRGFAEPGTFLPETVRQMRVIGVDSVPLVVLVAAFIGGVTRWQTLSIFSRAFYCRCGSPRGQTIIPRWGRSSQAGARRRAGRA